MIPKLSRKEARQLSQEHMGFNRGQFNTAYANAKTAVKDAGVRGKDKRQTARIMASGISETNPEINFAVENQLNLPEITGPAREGVITVGDMIEPTTASVQNLIQRVARKPSTVDMSGVPSARESLAAQNAKTNAWYQFQHEMDQYNRANNNYRANQDSAAYQRWLEEEFDRIYGSRDVDGNYHAVYHEPTTQDLIRVKGNTLKYGALPFSNSERESYGVDLNGNVFDLNGTGTQYSRRGTGISGGASQKAYDQGAAALGAMLYGPVVADVIGSAAATRGGNGSAAHINRALEEAGPGYYNPQASVSEARSFGTIQGRDAAGKYMGKIASHDGQMVPGVMDQSGKIYGSVYEALEANPGALIRNAAGSRFSSLGALLPTYKIGGLLKRK